jgi:DNA-binding transcriptional MerR regulator
LNDDITIADLAQAANVSPRTIRYYSHRGLLPSPSGAGRGSRYGPGHLARLQYIKRLQAQGLPLAEIEARLLPLSDHEVEALVGVADPPRRSGTSALTYVRAVLGETEQPTASEGGSPSSEASDAALRRPERSQWERISIAPHAELHIRRPLRRDQQRRVDRLITLATDLLEEDRR